MLQPSPEPIGTTADLGACRKALKAGSKSFAAASRLLPTSVRDAATILYAFCRDADDAVDLHDGGNAAVAQLRHRLDHIYAGTPRALPTDRALADVVARHALPRTLLDALIEGFEWDAQGRRYATIEDLEAYAARVAGSIGAMMAVLMGVRSPAAIARACDLGVAMQLTNIARDVGEDARAGRIYLPLEWLHDKGIEADRWLANPQFNDELRMIISNLLSRADVLYARVESGVAQLPAECRPGINAARFIYADIGRVLKSMSYDSVSGRAVVPTQRKLWLLLKSYWQTAASATSVATAPLAATRYLVEAVTASVPPAHARPGSHTSALSWWHMRSQALWLIDLFERMERRERARPRSDTAKNFTAS